MTTKLWTSVKVGRMTLPHRLAMSPMTRSRALPDGTPGELAELYYTQRASMGLLISEGTQPSDDGQGYIFTPGIYTDNHIAGWKRIIDSVHAAGGHFYIQLMHVGRISHPDNTLNHRQALAPSALAPGIQMFTLEGMKDIPVPKAMTTEDIDTVIGEFRHAARSAILAGADGVEIHGANGYLVHQFFAENANRRDDQYGGSAENRARFGIDVARAVADEIGPDRTGFRISPFSTAGGLDEGASGSDVYRSLISDLGNLKLAYLHVLHTGNDEFLREIRALWPTSLLVNRAGRPLDKISVDVDQGTADVAVVGAWALANPDLPERLKAGLPLNSADPATFFGGDEHGYTDYPTSSH